ncbi:hypothetical protein SO802_011745 [Lithocarpus litseifolius]|uniref:Transmembrane protein n=1 Tax=Lithocarpus litseifolius TaxID=425828 RepID=A0AAW2D1M0_9ROSI
MDRGGGGSWIMAKICSDLMDVVGLIWWIVAEIRFDFFSGISSGGEIWSDFGFCGVVFESLVVDAVVFLGFVVNLWVSVGHRFWVLGMLLFSGFCGESLWVSVGFSASASVVVVVVFFFFFFSGGGWDGYGFAGLRWTSVNLFG